MHLDKDSRRYAQRDRGQQLIGDAEQRPQRVDATQRVAHAVVQEIAPRQDDYAAGGHYTGHGGQSQTLAGGVADQLLQHEAADTRPGRDDS